MDIKEKDNNTILIIGIKYFKGIKTIIMITKKKDKGIMLNIGV